MTAKIIQLDPLGYCGICGRPLRKGHQVIIDVKTPEGSEKVHLGCMETSDTEPPAPRTG